MKDRLSPFVFSLIALAAGLAAPGAAQQEVPPGLTASGPIFCDGNEELVIRDLYISTDGDGVVAEDNCEVEILGSLIEAGGVGVRAEGNAEVEVYDSFVSGERGALVAEDQAEISFRDSTIRGRMVAQDFAEIDDDGGNDVSRQAARRGAGASGVRVESGEERVVVGGGGVSVETDDETVRVTPGGVVVGDGTTIGIGPGGEVRVDTPGESVVVGEDVSVETRDESVLITPEGVYTDEGTAVEIGPEGQVMVTADDETVLVEDGYVRISGGGEVVEITGDWRTGGTVYSSSDTERILIDLGAKVEAGKLLLQMAGDVLFEFNSAEILPAAAQELAKVAHLIRDRAAGTVYVVGHTDSVGDEAYNQQLSERRALSVMRWLNSRERIPIDVMAGQGRGEKSPIAYNTMPDGSDNPEGRARNRRVEISFGVAQR